uniref:Uncharacterized protein n=1 Tax=Anguilla anguilla TaxID=7936 RepID=A0A0E9W193_ANGAN
MTLGYMYGTLPSYRDTGLINVSLPRCSFAVWANFKKTHCDFNSYVSIKYFKR